jgi:hypothetical protein
MAMLYVGRGHMELYFLASKYVAFYLGEPLGAFIMVISNSFRRLIKTVKWEEVEQDIE